MPRGPALTGIAVVAALFGVAVPATAAASASACSTATPWRALVESHVRRYAALELSDVFKLFHQATLGSEHWVRAQDAAAWMRREWAALGEGPAEPLVDTIGPAFARVHLRPYRDAGGSPVWLADAFVATAQQATADTAALRCALAALRGSAEQGLIPWPSDSVARAAAAWQRAGYPSIHHAERFAAAYRPAYRVVSLSLVPALLARLPGGRR